MTRTVAALLVGGWLIGTLFMWAAALVNFGEAAELAAAPPAGFDPAVLESVARLQAGRANQALFAGWGWAQLALGAGAAALVWRIGRGAVRWLPLAAFVLVAGLQLFVVRPMNRLAATFELESRETVSAERERFGRLHGIYSGLDLLKAGLVAVTAAALAGRPRQGR